MTEVAFETEDVIEFDTVEFAGFFETPNAKRKTKSFHSIVFKEFSCFKDNKKSPFWNLKIDNVIYRRVIGNSIRILNSQEDDK